MLTHNQNVLPESYYLLEHLTLSLCIFFSRKNFEIPSLVTTVKLIGVLEPRITFAMELFLQKQLTAFTR